MRQQLTICFSLLTLLLSLASTATAADPRDGTPGRRVGGGTRWTAPRIKQPSSIQGKISALAFASRTGLPMAVRLKALYS